MTTQDTKLSSAEQDLKQLMADVARAMEKAQAAMARISGKNSVGGAEPEAAPSPR
jgi:hypothetical protein